MWNIVTWKYHKKYNQRQNLNEGISYMCISNALNHKTEEMTDEYMNCQTTCCTKINLWTLVFCLIENPFFLDSIMTSDTHQNLMHMKKQFHAKLWGCEKKLHE